MGDAALIDMSLFYCRVNLLSSYFISSFLSPLSGFPEAESVVVVEPHAHAFALAFVVAERPPEVVVLAAEPQASVDIAVAFVVLVPVSVVLAGVDTLDARFLAFPNVDYFASFSSSGEVVGEESVHSPIGARTNCGLCSIPSNPDLHQSINLGLCYNNPSSGHNNVSDTNGLPIDATTNHSRKRGLHQSQEQRKHMCQAALSAPVVRQIRWAEADQY